MFTVEEIARSTRALGLQGQVTISQAFALSSDPDSEIERIVELLSSLVISLMTVAPQISHPRDLRAGNHRQRPTAGHRWSHQSRPGLHRGSVRPPMRSRAQPSVVGQNPPVPTTAAVIAKPKRRCIASIWCACVTSHAPALTSNAAPRETSRTRRSSRASNAPPPVRSTISSSTLPSRLRPI